MGLKKNDTKWLLEQRIKVFKESRALAHLDKDQLSELAASAVTCHFKKGDYVIHEGDPAEFFYIIQDGRVKLYKESSFGKNFTVHIAIHGNAINAMALFEGGAHFLSAQAMDDITVLRIKREKWMSFTNKYPSTFTKILAVQTGIIKSAYERIIDLVGERVDQRLYNVLLMLSVKFGNTLFFTCEEIGDLVGTTTETTIRIFRRLKTMGVIRSSRGKIVIIDQKTLRELSMTPYFL